MGEECCTPCTPAANNAASLAPAVARGGHAAAISANRLGRQESQRNQLAASGESADCARQTADRELRSDPSVSTEW